MSKNCTNICKGIALVLMYIHHLFNNSEQLGHYSLIYKPLTMSQTIWIGQASKVCVAIFVFLTGYGYAKSIKGKETSNIDNQHKTIHRISRFLCNYWFCFLICFVLVVIFSEEFLLTYGTGKVEIIVNMFIDFLGLAFAFNTPTINATWWYVPLALIFIVVTPYIIKISKKMGISIFLVLVILPSLVGLNTLSSFIRYLPSLVLGIFVANNMLFERFKNKFGHRHYIDITLSIITIFVLLYIRGRLENYYYIIEAIVAMLICYIAYVGESRAVILNRGLALIGINSLNLFLFHSRIIRFFGKYFYSLKYCILILIVFLGVTLIISMLIERIKKFIHYERLSDKIASTLIRISYNKNNSTVEIN